MAVSVPERRPLRDLAKYPGAGNAAALCHEQPISTGMSAADSCARIAIVIDIDDFLQVVGAKTRRQSRERS